MYFACDGGLYLRGWATWRARVSGGNEFIFSMRRWFIFATVGYLAGARQRGERVYVGVRKYVV